MNRQMSGGAAASDACAADLLLVDGNDFSRTTVASSLRKAGFAVVSVSCVPEALRELQAAIGPDAIVVGDSASVKETAAFREVQSRDEKLVDIPIVMFSGCTRSDDASGELEQLLRTVRHCVGTRRTRR